MSEKWYLNNGAESDVVVSTRVRLARNLKDYPFPASMSPEQKKDLAEKVRCALGEGSRVLAEDLSFISMEACPEKEKYSLAERHLISYDFAKAGKGSFLLLGRDESVSVMINEEDHLRIQVLACGLDLSACYDTADKIDTVLDGGLSYAFDQRLGFLTQCPTNLGTGLRASVMLHLPALEASGLIQKLSATISKLGLTIRGTYGEGTAAKGSFYQISNQVTLGISERDAIENLRSIALQVVEQERAARKALLAADPVGFEDRACRALGTLQSARVISSDEAMELLSLVRLGIAEKVLPGLSFDQVSRAIAGIGAATIAAGQQESPDARERDVLRSRLLRAEFHRES